MPKFGEPGYGAPPAQEDPVPPPKVYPKGPSWSDWLDPKRMKDTLNKRVRKSEFAPAAPAQPIEKRRQGKKV